MRTIFCEIIQNKIQLISSYTFSSCFKYGDYATSRKVEGSSPDEVYFSQLT
jgi:hypothetical protein